MHHAKKNYSPVVATVHPSNTFTTQHSNRLTIQLFARHTSIFLMKSTATGFCILGTNVSKFFGVFLGIFRKYLLRIDINQPVLAY